MAAMVGLGMDRHRYSCNSGIRICRLSSQAYEAKEMTEAIFDHKISDMEWSVRTHNCLLNNFHTDPWTHQPRPGVKPLVTLGDLVRLTEAELLRVPNFGRKSLQEVKEILGYMGLHLGMDLSEPRNEDQLVLQDILVLFACIAEGCRYPVTIEVIKLGVRLHMRKGGNEWTTFFPWNEIKLIRRAQAGAILKRMEDNLDA
jgi:hypothetical protein